jgi:hypothetical protein
VPEEQHKCDRIVHIGTFKVERNKERSQKKKVPPAEKKENDIYTRYKCKPHAHTQERGQEIL